ncbi:chromosome segregation ATPase [Ordospora colligata OC4]|uniref:Chromosome segregation ATPase n=1 Tax=Ordospora colligata OC4 TaxID=1354746 RepID=A0A0B2UK36_9MICR|nr:chromosome segregation ATPase [Ordospora colligata OC4]KHN69330.1 chromosome segregation ATPase [Ordospora colligata OC4]
MDLRLESVTVHNFKSYRGTHVVDGLDPGFTAIIGPNGSGKSNIIDGILFVLGFRAKKMRHSSLRELIYNGEHREDMCYVELKFNKFTIRREAYQSRKSRYLVDGDERSTAEVAGLLSSEGVDMEHNRFLILQGEIESIAMMKPVNEGLLEYMEDVIGTSKYKADIKEGEEEMKKCINEYEGKAAMLSFYMKEYEHVERRKQEGMRAVEERLKYLSHSRDLHMLNAEVGRRRIHRLQIEREEVQSAIEQLIARIEENKHVLSNMDKDTVNASRKTRDVECKYVEIRRVYRKEERENRMIEDEMKMLQKRIVELNNQIEEAKKMDAIRQIKEAEYKVEMKNNEMEIKSSGKEASLIRKEIQEEQRNAEMKSKEKIEKIKEAEASLMQALKKKEEVCKVFRRYEERMEQLGYRKRDFEKKINDIDVKMEKIEGCKVSGNKDESQVKTEIEEVERDIEKTRREIGKRMQRASEYKENMESESKEKEIFEKVKNIPGVHGRLRDIGGVDAKYAKALFAAGKGLGGIVVDNTSTAERCVAEIKRLGVGRGMFMIVDRMGEMPVLRDEGVLYMCSLVECKEEFKKCFYFVLKDTVVCDDLEAAERIAFGRQRRRVVTLDGKLIEKSGVMSGGKRGGKAKETGDIEQAYEKMNELRNKLIKELCAIKNAKEREMLERQRKKYVTENEIVCREMRSVGGVDEKKEVELVNSELEDIKKKICVLRKEVEGLIPDYVVKNKERLTQLNAKIEGYERRNVELKMWMSEIEQGNVIDKEEEMRKINKRMSEIRLKDVSEIKSEMQRSQNEYNRNVAEQRRLEEQMNALRMEMKNGYDSEIKLKNRMEDIADGIEDSLKQVNEGEKHAIKICSEMKVYGDVIGSIAEPLSGLDMIDDESVERMRKKLGGVVAKMNGVVMSEIDCEVLKEYESVRNEYVKARDECEGMKKKMEGIRSRIEGMKKRRLDEFLDGLRQISKSLKEIYKEITYGGNAELELVDHLDPFSEGVVLSVMPPKKSWKSVSKLSGGEKTLSSLALIFALHRYKPSPFYVMDEIDAALDYRNVSVVSNYIKEMSATAQFVVISLRSDMFELSNTLVGVYKTENVSKFLVVDVGKLSIS